MQKYGINVNTICLRIKKSFKSVKISGNRENRIGLLAV